MPRIKSAADRISRRATPLSQVYTYTHPASARDDSADAHLAAGIDVIASWQNLTVEDDQDEEIDSDEAYEEGDDERFEAFEMKGRGKGKAALKKGPVVQDVDLDEGPSVKKVKLQKDSVGKAQNVSPAVQSSEEEIELNEDVEQNEELSSGSNDESSEDEEEDSDEPDEEDEDEDEESDDEDKNTNLINRISQLPIRKRPISRSPSPSADPSKASEAKKKRRIIPEQPAYGKESEFAVTPVVPQSQRTKKDLTQILPAEFLKASKAANISAAASAAVAVPLPTRKKEKIEREVAAEVLKKQTVPWDAAARAITNAKHLEFPLQRKADNVQTVEGISADFKPRTKLELEMADALRQEGIDPDQPGTSDLGPAAPVDPKVALEKLRHMRQLMSRAELKAKRISKIKSKTYRKIARKQREADKEKLAAAGLIDATSSADEERREKHERERALERATMRHKSSKWADRANARGAWEEGGRNDVQEMVAKADQLMKRIHGEKESGSDHSESDQSEDESTVRRNAVQKLRSAARNADADASSSGILGMKFMKDAAARNSKMLDRDIDDFETQMLGNTEAESSQTTNVHSNSGRLTINPGSAEINNAAASEPAYVAAARAEAAAECEPRKRFNFDEDEETKSNPWLQSTSEGPRLSKKKNIATVGLNSKAVDKSAHAFKKAGQKALSAKAMAADEATVALDLTKVMTKKSKVKSSKADAAESGGDSDDGFDGKAISQRDLVAQAFAGDNVVADFVKSKKAQISADAPKEEDLTLSGWGTWSGKGISKRKEKKRKFVQLIDGVDATERKDARLSHVIISEKQNKAIKKYGVNDLPHPFTSRRQYEDSLRTPLGREWNAERSTQSLTKPRIIVKSGEIIAPIKRLF